LTRNEANKAFVKIAELKSSFFKRGDLCNFFSIMGKENDEVTHSSILAELLNPKGTHGQGSLILSQFLLLAAIDIKSDISRAIVKTEYYCDEEAGRIDILISFGQSECIIIENKIFANDQPQQLWRYYKWSQRKGYETENVHIVYLTPEGNTPSNDSAQKLERILTISYRREIRSLLKKSKEIALSDGKANIVFVLDQYEGAINKFLGIMNEKLKEEILAVLEAGNFNQIIPELEESITYYKAKVQHRFWTSLTQLLNDSNISNTKVHAPGFEAILNYYKSYNKPRIILEWPLLTDNLDCLTLKLQIMTNFAYGFVCNEENSWNVEPFKGLGFNEDTSRKNWMVWKYPSPELEKLDFKNFNQHAFESIEQEKIEYIANEIISNVKLILGTKIEQV